MWFFSKEYRPSRTISLLPLVLIVPTILFEALSLSGCASTAPGIPDIFAVSLVPTTNFTRPSRTLSPNNDIQHQVDIRIGFFGVCVFDGTGSSRCQSSNKDTPPLNLTRNLFPNSLQGDATAIPQADALALSVTALALQSRILASPLLGCVALHLAGLAALAVYAFARRRYINRGKSEKLFRCSRWLTYAFLYFNAALLFATAFAITTTTNALDFVSSADGAITGGVRIQRGLTMMVLLWMAFAFSLMFAMAVPLVVRCGRGADREVYDKERE